MIDQPICLRFESHMGAVRDGGCYDGLRISGGELFAGEERGKLLASCDEASQYWTTAEGLPQMSHVLILPALPARWIGESSLEN